MKERIEKIQQYLENTGTKQATIARGAGISPTVLNQILKGQYAGKIEVNLAKIEDVINSQKLQLQSVFRTPNFIKTTISDKIFNALDEEKSLSFPRLLVLYGNSGIGKTESIDEYVKENPTSVVIKVLSTLGTGALLQTIAKAIDVSPHGTQHAILERIINRFRDSKRMLIIDEAEYLSPKNLDILRRIQDLTKIPMVLLGMPNLYHNISSLRKGGFEQIRNRMAPYNLGIPTKEDLTAIILECIPNAEETIIKTLIECSNKTIRTLIILLQEIVNWSAISGNKITQATVHKLASNLN